MAITPLHDEKTLLAQLAEGDEYAFKKIYSHYHEHVYMFSLWYLKSPTEAEEVVQETFLKLWLLGTAVKQIDDLRKYLRSIAGNKALDLLRQRARRIKTTTIDDLEDSGPIHHDTEEGILLKEFRKMVSDGVAQLPQQQRLVYQLCQEQGLKNDEVAKKLDLSPLTVRTHMKLALRFLRTYIRKHSDQATLLPIVFLLKNF